MDWRRYFGNFFVPFGLPKMIVVDADGLFDGIFKKTFQETLLITVHEVARRKHKAIINEGFHRYLKKVNNINSMDKAIPHQWFQQVFFALYAWNAGQVDGTEIYLSIVDIVREFLFKIDLSPEISREDNSE